MKSQQEPYPHRRRSFRLQHYDYSTPGAYFVTVCAYERRFLFGKIENDEMRENTSGAIVRKCWAAIPEHFPHVTLDAFVVMPNHVHGIIFMNAESGENERAQHAAPVRRPAQQRKNIGTGSLGAIVRSFKSACTKRINEMRGKKGSPVWQRNYYERVIRHEGELEKIRQYVSFNPALWASDWENPGTSSARSDHRNEIESILEGD